MDKQKQHKKGLISSIIFYVITALLVFFITVNLIAPNNVVNITGFQLSVIPTHSMKPNINRGDIIILTKVDQDNVQEGDIVVYYNYINVLGGYRYERVVHRVVEIEEVGGELRYYTQGDNLETNPTTDDMRNASGQVVSHYLTNDMFVAKVPQIGSNDWALRIPWLGFPVLLLQWLIRFFSLNPILFLLIVANIGIIVTLIVVLRKNNKKKESIGMHEEKTHIKAKDITSDDEHDRNDDEEDGSA